MAFIFFGSLMVSLMSEAKAERSVLIGTDVPYQFYVGANRPVKKSILSLRTGLLVGPYSDMTLKTISLLGTDDVYIRLLETSYRFGSMNSIGTQHFLGQNKRWFTGPELRLDYLTASETSSELVEAVVGQSISGPSRFRSQPVDVELGLRLFAAGLRAGRIVQLGNKAYHKLNIEFSLYKHFHTRSKLLINGARPESVDDRLNDLLWADVFWPYGYLCGLGINYGYSF